MVEHADAHPPRTRLEEALGQTLDPESCARDAGVLESFLAQGPEQQDFVCHWLPIVSASDEELRDHFLANAAIAFAAMDQQGVEAWLLEALQAFDSDGPGPRAFERPSMLNLRFDDPNEDWPRSERAGLNRAIHLLKNPAEFSAWRVRAGGAAALDSCSGFLQQFLTGLGGRALHIGVSDRAYTDTETVYLPARLSVFDEPEDNRELFKLTAVHQWAQTRFGTWREAALDFFEAAEPADAEAFRYAESIRLDSCLAREFPGLYSQLCNMAYRSGGHGEAWRALEKRWAVLTDPGASVGDSLALAAGCELELPEPRLYWSMFDADAIRSVREARIEREKNTMKRALDVLQREMNAAAEDEGGLPGGAANDGFSLEESGADGEGGVGSRELRYRGERVALPPELASVMDSILQDLGEIPDDYLEDLAAVAEGLEEEDPDAWGADGETLYYREWDYLRQRYREDFCQLRERDCAEGNENFIAQTRDKYAGQLKSIRKTFEAVLGESRQLRRQSQGDDIDIDALVEAQADLAAGHEMSEYLYTRYRNVDRSIAVLLMVDMSASTIGWVNDAERESLILLAEALETLGDAYAIYGFSGRTNERCDIYRIKGFDEGYNLDVQRRISGISAKGFTRMGVAIRHLGQLLNQTPARTKLLITLSDGCPEDYDRIYRGQYAVEDTRQSLLELRQDGVNAYCITIDKQGQDYLPHMYGAANYAVVKEVEKLPLKVADIYRRLTAQ